MSNPAAETTANAASSGSNILAPDVLMVVLTWVTFFILFAILKKYAWLPILAALKKREDYIRGSLAEADKVKADVAQAQESKNKIIAEARMTAQTIIDEARKKAVDVAHGIEDRAKKQAQDAVETAHQEIAGERERARAALRKESADIAVNLASKLLKENLDKAKSDRLIEQYIKEI
jgi:F-type H+-transporting ATPase subunit b